MHVHISGFPCSWRWGRSLKILSLGKRKKGSGGVHGLFWHHGVIVLGVGSGGAVPCLTGTHIHTQEPLWIHAECGRGRVRLPVTVNVWESGQAFVSRSPENVTLMTLMLIIRICVFLTGELCFSLLFACDSLLRVGTFMPDILSPVSRVPCVQVSHYFYDSIFLQFTCICLQPLSSQYISWLSLTPQG